MTTIDKRGAWRDSQGRYTDKQSHHHLPGVGWVTLPGSGGGGFSLNQKFCDACGDAIPTFSNVCLCGGKAAGPDEDAPPPGFDWEQWKADQNPYKHDGVTFLEGTTVFDDENRLSLFDEKNSADEIRYRVIGVGGKSRLLLVSHVAMDSNGTIKILSARKANKNEHNRYRNHR